MKIAVIGAGSMGMAFVRCWLNREIQSKDKLVIVESSEARINELARDPALRISKDFSSIEKSQFIFLAVKPQDFKAAGSEIAKYIASDQCLVSIMAGVSIESIRKELGGHKQIVRVMPNLPILVEAGISAYFPDPSVDQLVLNILDQLLSAGGEVLRLNTESLMNAVTATSGSGPGYIFYILNSLMSAAKDLGFSEEQAKNLLASTVKGAVDLWQKDGRSAGDLCRAVTSKGGTTEAALSVFEKNNLGRSLVEAVKNAEKRAEELSRGS